MTDGSRTKLSKRAERCLIGSGLNDRALVIQTLRTNWNQVMCIKDVGEKTFLEICAWAGVDDPRKMKDSTPFQFQIIKK